MLTFIVQNYLSCYTGYPEVNAGRRIKHLDANNDLLCGGDLQGPTHALLTVLIILAMGCLIVLLGWVNRARLRKMGPALADSFSQRMQYSTIKNAFNDGPNDHLPENSHTVTYTLRLVSNTNTILKNETNVNITGLYVKHFSAASPATLAAATVSA